MVISSMKELKSPPPKISKRDFEIRNKALDLLTRTTPEHEIVFSYDRKEKNECIWDPLEPISYQKSADAVLEEEREAKKTFRHASAIVIERDSSFASWTDALMPVQSCISNACRVGISGIAQQTAAGFRMARDEVEERVFASTVARSSRLGKYSTIPDHIEAHRNNQPGQSTSEENTPKQLSLNYIGQNNERFTDPEEFQPLGFLFIPSHHEFSSDKNADETMSQMTEENRDRRNERCPGFCLFGFTS